jgi:branched-chain amino acid transport system permease protein
VFVIATMGLNLTIGYAGQKSLGHAAFFGIGAYTVAILMKAGFSFWLGLPAAALICFAVGLAWASRRCGCRPSTWPSPRWASTPPSGW